MHTDGWRLVALEDGSSSSSDPEEAALKISHTAGAARRTLVGIELMNMMKKKQGVGAEDNDAPSAAEQFYSLAVEAPHRQGNLPFHPP
jgi:hypothetical protein